MINRIEEYYTKKLVEFSNSKKLENEDFLKE